MIVLILFLGKTFFFLWSRVIDRAMPLYKECLKKHHMTPTEPFTLLPRFVAKDYGEASTLLTLKTKKSLEKDSIFATNHSHAIFVTKELISSSSSLHPTPFMVQAKNFPPQCRLRVAFWRYAFGGTLFMKTCRD